MSVRWGLSGEFEKGSSGVMGEVGEMGKEVDEVEIFSSGVGGGGLDEAGGSGDKFGTEEGQFRQGETSSRRTCEFHCTHPVLFSP